MPNYSSSMHRLRKGSSLIQNFSLRRKALNSSIQDAYYSTKDTFERHKVVFTIATSAASVATAWVGYTLRHFHERKVERRLDSIEAAMRTNHHIGHAEFKKIVGSNSSGAAYAATAGASLIIGYGMGWRGGKWYANRKHRKEQMKLLEKLKPRRSPFNFLGKRLKRWKKPETAIKASEAPQKEAASEVRQNDVLITPTSAKAHPAC